MSALNDVPEQLQDALSGFLSTDVVHIDSGMSLGGQSFDVEFDIAAAVTAHRPYPDGGSALASARCAGSSSSG
jgi:hypothetical protein